MDLMQIILAKNFIFLLVTLDGEKKIPVEKKTKFQTKQ